MSCEEFIKYDYQKQEMNILLNNKGIQMTKHIPIEDDFRICNNSINNLLIAA